MLNAKFYCVKCEEIKERYSTLNELLPNNVCEMLGEYDRCEKCKRKTDYSENSLNEDKSKISRILLHMIFHNPDIKTNIWVGHYKHIIHNPDIKTNIWVGHYKHIIKRSPHPHRKIMKHFLNIHNGTYHRVTYVEGGDGEVQDFITHRGGGYNCKK